MTALAVYHVLLDVDGPDEERHATVGVCAATKTEAAKLAHERMVDYGSVRPRVAYTLRVAPQGDWEPGTTLIYRVEGRRRD